MSIRDALKRKENETPFQYQKRLIYGKLVDKTLSNIDYTELAKLIYGKPYSRDVARRMMYGSRRTLDLMNKEAINLSADSVISDLDEKMIEFKKEKQKMFDQRTALNKIIRERARQEELNEIIANAIKNIKHSEMEYKPRPLISSDNDLMVSLNDIHFGANIKNAWNEYNSDICREMMHNYADDIIKIKERHKSENCFCWMNGDAISGNIHYSIAVTNKENVIEQITGVSEVISEFLEKLSGHFNKVTLVTVAGNHSRINPNKENALMTERLDDLIEWYISARLQNLKNVVIGSDKIDPTVYTIDIRGKLYGGIHGDYDNSPTKIQSLRTMIEDRTKRKLYALMTGHMHHNKTDSIQGLKVVMAGSFLGVDDYCVGRRILGTQEQLVSVCDEGGFACHYDVPLKRM